MFSGLYDESMREWFTKFLGRVDFQDLVRAEKGVLGLEKRRMPDGDRDSGGLRRWQTQRVNRLIVESLVPEWVLPRADYLNTGKVAGQVFKALQTAPTKIVIYAHPDHFAWCRKNTRSAFGSVFGTAAPCLIEDGAPGGRWDAASLWDQQSAQVWTRCRENYVAYNNL